MVSKTPQEELFNREEIEGGDDGIVVINECCPRSLDRDPADRGTDRLMACLGLLDDAAPLFKPGARVKGAGVLLAIPALTQSGIFTIAGEIYGSIGPAFYGLRTSLLTFLLMALLRIKRPENIKEHSPGELGRLLGLDRAPEVKTLRRKLDGRSCSYLLADQGIYLNYGQKKCPQAPASSSSHPLEGRPSDTNYHLPQRPHRHRSRLPHVRTLASGKLLQIPPCRIRPRRPGRLHRRARRRHPPRPESRTCFPGTKLRLRFEVKPLPDPTPPFPGPRPAREPKPDISARG